MKIAVIYDVFREDTLGEYYKRALIRAGHQVDHFWLRRADEIKDGYDLYFRVDDGDYKYDIPHAYLKPAIFYASDTHLKKPLKKIEKLALLYDKIFCAQYDGYMELSRRFPGKASWLPHAADPHTHKDLGVKRDLDVGFIGTDGGVPRKFFLQAIREKYPNSFIGAAPCAKISGIYSRAKIVFNYSINNDINMRMFEAMICGALLVTNFIEGNGFGKLFEDRKNLVLYSTPKEIFHLIDYCLSHEEERSAIAKEGKRLALEKFTYDNRVAEIFKQCQKGF